MSTLVTDERSSRKAALLGVCWGLGHTLALVLVGLRVQMPASAADLFELAVALMLVGLGVRAIHQAASLGRGGPSCLHHHGRTVHTHPSSAPHVHIGAWTLARRPLIVGAVHGLAGSGALTALVLATLPSTAARLSYLALFGMGSTIGMAVFSGMVGWPLARLARHQTIGRGVSLTVGCVSTIVGVVWGYPLVGRLL